MILNIQKYIQKMLFCIKKSLEKMSSTYMISVNTSLHDILRNIKIALRNYMRRYAIINL